jgi:beta-aspartyl-peptidase (threonine type)
MLAKRLLSERGSLEIDTEQRTFTVTDRRAAVESIRRLVESHALGSSSTELADPDDAKSSVAIRAVLDAQIAAWNRADIEGYMDGYDLSPDTRIFFGENFHGWRDTLERHKRTYDTPEKMGVLTFLEVDFAMLSKDAALVFGRLHLQQVNDESHGRFTLLFKKMKDGWRIVYDHTAST